MEVTGLNRKKKAVGTIVLVVFNVVVFFVLSFLGDTEDTIFMLEKGAMYVPDILEKGKYYELITSMFLHFGFAHLMNNMLMLLVIGYNIEPELGTLKYLLLYFGSGIGGNLLSMWADLRSGVYYVSAGASGAIYGMVGALVYLAIRKRGDVGNIRSGGLPFMLLYSFYYGYQTVGVDGYAHLGGFLTGLLLAVLLYRKRDREDGSFAGC